jgi:MFS transporter, FHS family, glucose/mannose:H+ symporter
MSTQAIAVNAAPRQRYLFALLSLGFVLTGLEITLLGPLLPVFIARWSLTYSQAAIFFPVEFSASLAGVWLSSLLTHYFGNRTPVVLGYTLVVLGLATLNASSMTVTILALAALGLGYGLVVPPTNLTVADLGGERRASFVSLVNLAWGIGAVTCSPLVLVTLNRGLLSPLLLCCAGVCALLVVCFFFSEFPQHKMPPSVPAMQGQERGVGFTITFALAGMFFFYVGMEVSFGLWGATYALQLPGGAGLATIAPMFFYGGLMIGRASVPAILARVRELPLVVAALIMVLIGNTLLILATRQKFAFGFMVIAGLGCSSIFPICVAWLSHWYGRKAVRVGGLMFSMASLGSAFAPWFVGVVSAHAGGLRMGALVPLGSAIVMLFLLLLVRRQAAA